MEDTFSDLYGLPKPLPLPNFSEEPACKGLPTSWWYPRKPWYAQEEERAKSYCIECPCKQECLDYRNEHKIIFGIWGGETEPVTLRERQRKARQAQRRKDAAQDALEASHTNPCTSDTCQNAMMDDVEP